MRDGIKIMHLTSVSFKEWLLTFVVKTKNLFLISAIKENTNSTTKTFKILFKFRATIKKIS